MTTIPPLDPIATAARRAKREQLLGDNAACALCGLANLEALTPRPRSILEAHHVVGRANDGALTVPLCRNCHATLTEGYAAAGVTLNQPPTLLHRLLAVLRALGALFVTLGERLLAWAAELAGMIARLDATHPSWREDTRPA